MSQADGVVASHTERETTFRPDGTTEATDRTIYNVNGYLAATVTTAAVPPPSPMAAAPSNTSLQQRQLSISHVSHKTQLLPPPPPPQEEDVEDDFVENEKTATKIRGLKLSLPSSLSLSAPRVSATARATPLLFRLLAVYEPIEAFLDVLSDIIFAREFGRVYSDQYPSTMRLLIATIVIPQVLISGIVTKFFGSGVHILCRILLFPIALPISFATLIFCDLVHTASAIFCYAEEKECSYPTGMPASHFFALRAIIIGVFEDIPQLVVQCWVFATNKQGSDEFSSWELMFAFCMTIVSLAHQSYALRQRGLLLRDADLSFWQHYSILFGFERGNQEVSKTYAALIREGNYSDNFLSMEYWNVGNAGCNELIDSIEWSYYHQHLHHHRHHATQNWGIYSLNFTGNDIGNEGAIRIAAALARGVPFREIHLGVNNITDTGAVSLASAMKEPGCKLRELSLHNNDGITQVGYMALLDAVRVRVCKDCPEWNYLGLRVSKCEASACLSEECGLSGYVTYI